MLEESSGDLSRDSKMKEEPWKDKDTDLGKIVYYDSEIVYLDSNSFYKSVDERARSYLFGTFGKIIILSRDTFILMHQNSFTIYLLKFVCLKP